jgi:hypothetical protein
LARVWLVTRAFKEAVEEFPDEATSGIVPVDAATNATGAVAGASETPADGEGRTTAAPTRFFDADDVAALLPPDLAVGPNGRKKVRPGVKVQETAIAPTRNRRPHRNDE